MIFHSPAATLAQASINGSAASGEGSSNDAGNMKSDFLQIKIH